MNFLNSILEKIYGTSWRTSIIGDLYLIFSYAKEYGLTIPSSMDEAQKIFFPALFAIGMRFAKDHNVTGGSVPNAVPKSGG